MQSDRNIALMSHRERLISGFVALMEKRHAVLTNGPLRCLT